MPQPDLTRWPVLCGLEPEFVQRMQVVFVYLDYQSGQQRLQSAVILTDDDMVYTLVRQAGVNVSDTSTLRCVDVLTGRGVKTFTASVSSDLLALTHTGKVYVWDDSSSGPKSIHDITPRMVELPPNTRIVDIACGAIHSLALTNDGDVYTWGSNSLTALDPPTRPGKSEPIMIAGLKGKRLTSIACGGIHSVAVSENGELYSWGENRHGELGRGRTEYSDEERHQPRKITALDDIAIVKVACGPSHTLALSNKGVVYSWGLNNLGQLGLEHNEDVFEPTIVSHPEMGRVADIAATNRNHTSVAVTKSGCVFVWGAYDLQEILTPLSLGQVHVHDIFAFALHGRGVMHEPLLLCRDGDKRKSVLYDLEEAFDDEATSDTIIRVEGKPIHVHKAVLMIRCQHFRTLIPTRQGLSSPEYVSSSGSWIHYPRAVFQVAKTIDIETYSYTVYRAFLEYLYTDDIDLSAEDSFELLELATAYGLSQLRRISIEMIKEGISVENAGFLYGRSIACKVQGLEEFCFKFSLEHLTAVTQSASFADLDQSIQNSFFLKISRAGGFKT